MTLTNPPSPAPPISGAIIKVSEFGKPVTDSLTELDARTSDVATGNPALGTRVGALETTVNATGTTAAGNAALSTRLGTGVTTASTATAQLATKVATSRQILAGTGLTGGGDFSADRTLTVAYGTSGTTATVGNDARVTVTQDATIGNSALGTRVSTLETRPYVTLIQSSLQSIPNSADTIVGNWTVTGAQQGTMFVAGNNFITIPTTGFYMFTGTVVYAGDGTGMTGQRVAYFTTGAPASTGATTLASAFLPSVASTIAGTTAATVPLPLSGGAYLTSGTQVFMYTYQNSGGALSTRASFGGRTYFSAFRIA